MALREFVEYFLLDLAELVSLTHSAVALFFEVSTERQAVQTGTNKLRSVLLLFVASRAPDPHRRIERAKEARRRIALQQNGRLTS